MAGLFTVKTKQGAVEVDVYATKPTIIDGKEQSMFYVYDTRSSVGEFGWYPSTLFLPVDGGSFEPEIPVESIDFDPTSVTMTEGDTQAVTVTLGPADNTTGAQIISSNTNIVESTGALPNITLTAVNAGSATVLCTAPSGVSKALQVNVNRAGIPVTDIQFIAKAFNLAVGSSYSLSYSIFPANATDKTIQYNIDDPTVISAVPQAPDYLYVTALKAGTAVLTVGTHDGGYTDTCTITVTPNSRTVGSSAELEAALNDAEVGEIILSTSFELMQFTDVERPLTLRGAGNTLSFRPSTEKDGLTIVNAQDVLLENIRINMLENEAGWKGDYACQIYNSSSVILDSCVFTGADAGLLVNSSEVEFANSLDVGGNSFGGCEVSAGTNPKYTPTLDINGAVLVNNTEAYSLPTIWIDGATGVVNGADGLYEITLNNQKQYYIDESHTTE